jgi:hypothetical protein
MAAGPVLGLYTLQRILAAEVYELSEVQEQMVAQEYVASD